MPASLLRTARKEDLPRIVEIYNAAIPSRVSTADLEPVTVAGRRKWFEAHDAQRPIWVHEDGGRVSAWAALSPYHERAAYGKTAEVSLYLAPEVQGRGLGRGILQEVLERASVLGVETLLALVFGHNPASLKLFQRAGFEEWGRLPGVAELDGNKRDLLFLGRRLIPTSRIHW
ncbi:MAG: N-acetyltransferase family protein [Verrucomicrobiota bacterium]